MHVFSCDDRQRDVFPLPLAPVPRLSRRDLSRGVRQRLGMERATESQLAARLPPSTRCMVLRLDEAWAARSRLGPSTVSSGGWSATSGPPTCCRPVKPPPRFWEQILATTGPRITRSLHSIDAGRSPCPWELRHLRRSLRCWLPRFFLLVDEFVQRLSLSPDEYDAVFRGLPRIVPYMDPALASMPDDSHNFVDDLHRCHVIGFTQHLGGTSLPSSSACGGGSYPTGH